MNSRTGIAVGSSRLCPFPLYQLSSRFPANPSVLWHRSRSTPPTAVINRTGGLNSDHLTADSPQVELPASEEALLNELEKREGFRRERAKRKHGVRKARKTYQFVACAASLLMAGMAAGATFFKVFFTKPKGSPFPLLEFLSTLGLVAMGTACMEMYARWAHKVWWHDLPAGWALHKSHHAPRKGPFEANDIYAVANAIPAFTFCAIGFCHAGVFGSLLFGFGLGITLFGIAYMFVHDGLVHKRFPVGPLSNVPFMKRVAAAHMLHHAHKYDGKPFGMFLGPQEIKMIPGAEEEMNRLATIL